MIRSLLAMALALAALEGPAAAQEWPTRPVTLVVPFAAGGPIDVVARLVAPHLGEALGQTVIVENIGGAGGMTGASRVAKSSPDGYTFVFGNQGTHTYSQLLYKKPLYNAVNEFTPVGLLVGNTKVLTVRKDLPVGSLQEFIAYAKANQDKMQYGSAGGGSATHIACVLLNDKIGTKITHVPYRGAGPALQDLVAGRIDFTCEVISTALSQIKSGTIKALASLSMERTPVLPDLPTALELGLPGVDAEGWNGFFFPQGTPDAIVRKLNAATQKALGAPPVIKRLGELGLNMPKPDQRSPEFLSKLVLTELHKWGPPMKASGLSVD
jgi:tripartite-type tricarboxylate transporter receptor subunit TctC